MSIVTFWNNGREQTGKTLSMAAIGTYMAIQHNYRILIIATGYKDETLKNLIDLRLSLSFKHSELTELFPIICNRFKIICRNIII